MAKRDYYDVLGLTKTATQDEIKKAFRKKAVETHPDKGGDENLFKEIAESYEVLSDEDKKRQYDTYGHNTPKQGPSGDPFQDLFRRSGFNPFAQGSVTRPGTNMNLTLKLALEEIFTGTSKKFKYKRNVHCKPCSGKGGTNVKTCTTCGGSGAVREIINTPFGQIHSAVTCNVCGGQGFSYESICVSCAGEGVNSIDESVDIQIPSGVVENMSMVLSEKGHAVKNGGVGDLIISILEIPHENFIRTGNDLKFSVKLTYPQMVLGDKIDVNIIEGGKIRIQITEYTKVGDIFKIPSKGMKLLNTGTRGDLLVIVDLLMPNKIDSEERKLIEELKKINQKIAI